ncbi:DUF4129 domain-containing protein [Haloarcula nitratireducens]|uniref:DUF4129 domain-containing protein n=1 Tax=Haloarcula nitratireducens TaxID=2487749 RepID=A0AAW4PDJ7_9EURY|nr:DUF4129 domain-containing protein [Halomicroarcula nitratireducens]MBX0296004.1 DUF4129 domain-containing protein [Halomicroarcula nitratireducens]
MQRQSLLVALVAAVALLSFALGAAGLDAATGGEDPDVTPEDGGIESQGQRDVPSNPGGVDSPESGTGARSLVPPLSPPVIGVLVAGVALGVAGLWWAAGRGSTVDEAGGDRPTFTTGDAAAGSSYSATAADVPLTNDVYRAWADLTERFGPDDGTATPREFAERATAAGADAEAVETLRDLFERVRYGSETPTPVYETRARDALDSATGADRQPGAEAATETESGAEPEGEP